MQAAEVQNSKPDRCLPCTATRQFIQTAVLIFIFLLLFRAIGAEPYQVPTGSMWPALAGNHRAADCPRCGYRVVVGRHRPDKTRTRDNLRYYRQAVCPNCGYCDLHLDQVPECPGDHLLVNKNVFQLRRPRRWEMAVFHCPVEPARAFVKRVIGLPGEHIQIRQGDIYVNHHLARKTLDEVKAVRIPVFDNNYQASSGGFRDRWESQALRPEACTLAGTALHLRTEDNPQQYQCLVYRHFSLDEKQSHSIQDEYAYNGGDPREFTPVHDFMVECDLTVLAGKGWVLFGITDGGNRLIVELPVANERAQHPDEWARVREGTTPFRTAPRGPSGQPRIFRRAPALRLVPGRTYHIELAFVDRRLSLSINGSFAFAPVDLPPVNHRSPVIRPIKIGARGVQAVVSNVRLFRDIYYTEAGSNGIRQVVSLGLGEYFVLGDNSPNSDDSRFWPNRGVVPEANFIGKPFLVHLPNRVVHWPGLGQARERIAPDWGRIRWLH